MSTEKFLLSPIAGMCIFCIFVKVPRGFVVHSQRVVRDSYLTELRYKKSVMTEMNGCTKQQNLGAAEA